MKSRRKITVSVLLLLCCTLILFGGCATESAPTVIRVKFVDANGNDAPIPFAAGAPVNGGSVQSGNSPAETEASPTAVPSAAAVPSTTEANKEPEKPTGAATPTQPAQTTASAEPSASNASAPAATDAPATQPSASQVPATAAPATQSPAPSETPAFSYTPLNKKGDLYKAEGQGKIWAKIVGSCYILFRDIDEPNEWTEKGKVYELYVTYVRIGENYSMWSDGYWELSADGTKLTLTPVNQGENGNVGVEAGGSKTFTGNNGVFEIPVTFEQGGGTTVILDLSKPLA
ncbi:MAG: hypothetical protein IK108_05485 [Clostridia bacterium]|nr:hypothetical protein [Clostridia bacterium]